MYWITTTDGKSVDISKAHYIEIRDPESIERQGRRGQLQKKYDAMGPRVIAHFPDAMVKSVTLFIGTMEECETLCKRLNEILESKPISEFI